MKIDRSAFLLFTVAIAAGACVVNPPPQDPQNPQTASTTDPNAPAIAPVPGATGSATNPGLQSARRGLREGPGAPSTEAADAGTPTTPPPTPPPATQCLDNGAASAGDCAAVASCAAAKTKCENYKTLFKPKVAANAVACLNTHAANVCSNSVLHDCQTNALKSACVEQQVVQACGMLASNCKETVDSCSTIVSGLNDAGRQKVLTYCAGEGCKNGLAACVDAMTGPAVEGGADAKKK
jgi:hypothetical protein